MAEPDHAAARRGMEAVRRLKTAIAEAIKDDPEFLSEAVESETDFMETLDALLRDDMLDASLAAAIDAAADGLDVRRRRINERAARRRVIIAEALSLLEAKTLQRPVATVTMASRPRKLIIADETQIPKTFYKKEIVIKLDKDKIKATIEGGKDVPGAHLDNGAPTLTIRRR